MRRYPAIQIGSAEPYSGDMTRWYVKNNLTYGPITAEVTDGTGVVSISDMSYADGRWSLTATGLSAGRSLVTITATTASDRVRKFTFLVEVREKSKLNSGQAYQTADYG